MLRIITNLFGQRMPHSKMQVDLATVIQQLEVLMETVEGPVIRISGGIYFDDRKIARLGGWRKTTAKDGLDLINQYFDRPYVGALDVQRNIYHGESSKKTYYDIKLSLEEKEPLQENSPTHYNSIEVTLSYLTKGDKKKEKTHY